MRRNRFAQRLAKLRALRHLSLKALSKLSGIAASTIGDLETGQRKDTKVSTLEKLCIIFNVSIDYILGYEEISGMKRNSLPLDNSTHAKRICLRCADDLQPGESHMYWECIMHLRDQGLKVERISILMECGVFAVEAIIADGDSRRLGRRLRPGAMTAK